MKLVLKTVQPSQGMQWVQQSLKLFARQPLALTGLFGTFLFVALVLLMVPLLGGLIVLAAVPLLGLVMMMGTAAAVRGQPVMPTLYLAPFRTDPLRRRRLLTLCVGYGVATLLILMLSDWLDGGKLNELQNLMASGRDDETTRDELQALLTDPQLRQGLFTRLGLTALLSLPFWHAPALVWWGQQGVAQALFSSSLALWRSKGAFLVYVGAWFALVALCGMALGLLLQALGAGALMGVLAMPLGMTLSVVFYASLYFMFVHTFSAVDAPGEPRDDDAPEDIPA